MTEVKFRLATTADTSNLCELATRTFWDTYQTNSKIENKYIKEYMAKAFDPVQIESELIEENTIFIIGENSSDQVGYAKLVVESSRPEISAVKPIEISRIYLDKKYWGKQIGAKILKRCFNEAKEHVCDEIWLSVWEHNPRAIRFYEKYGFETIGSHIFDLASSLQTDFIMTRKIKNYV